MKTITRIRWSLKEREMVLQEAKRLLDSTGRTHSMGDAQKILAPNRHRPTNASNEFEFRKWFRERWGGAAAQGIVAEAPPMSVQEIPESVAEAVDETGMEQKVIDFAISVIDGICSHPAVITAVHRLVHSAFEKEASEAIDKAAAWPQQTIASRLPRILIVGVRPQNQESERIEAQFGKELAIRFWSPDTQSKHTLKQMLYNSERVVVIPSRVGHDVMAMVKARTVARTKKQPWYVKGMGSADIIKSLDYLTKEILIEVGG